MLAIIRFGLIFEIRLQIWIGREMDLGWFQNYGSSSIFERNNIRFFIWSFGGGTLRRTWVLIQKLKVFLLRQLLLNIKSLHFKFLNGIFTWRIVLLGFFIGELIHDREQTLILVLLFLRLFAWKVTSSKCNYLFSVFSLSGFADVQWCPIEFLFERFFAFLVFL